MEDYETVTKISGEPIVGSMLPSTLDPEGFNLGERYLGEGISAYQIWQVQKERQRLRYQYLEHWEKTAEVTGTGRPVDAIICAVAPYTAPPHGHNKYISCTDVYFSSDLRKFQDHPVHYCLERS